MSVSVQSFVFRFFFSFSDEAAGSLSNWGSWSNPVVASKAPTSHPRLRSQAWLSHNTSIKTTAPSSARIALEVPSPPQQVTSSHPRVPAVSITFTTSPQSQTTTEAEDRALGDVFSHTHTHLGWPFSPKSDKNNLPPLKIFYTIQAFMQCRKAGGIWVTSKLKQDIHSVLCTYVVCVYLNMNIRVRVVLPDNITRMSSLHLSHLLIYFFASPFFLMSSPFFLTPLHLSLLSSIHSSTLPRGRRTATRKTVPHTRNKLKNRGKVKSLFRRSMCKKECGAASRLSLAICYIFSVFCYQTTNISFMVGWQKLQEPIPSGFLQIFEKSYKPLN